MKHPMRLSKSDYPKKNPVSIFRSVLPVQLILFILRVKSGLWGSNCGWIQHGMVYSKVRSNQHASFDILFDFLIKSMSFTFQE